MKILNLLEACSIMGDALALRMTLVSNREEMSSLMPLRKLSNFVKGKAPMVQDNEGYILYPAGYPKHKIRRNHSSSRQSTHVKLPKKKTPTTSNEPIVSFKTFDASYVLTNKSGKVVVASQKS
jgi:hypothetical protein